MTPCHNRDEWTSEDPADRLLAALECGGCPIAQQCLDGAMERRERFAVFGVVDFSFTSTAYGFTCGAVNCIAVVHGLGRRGDHTVPACKAHSFDAQVTVLEPVPRPVPAVERTLGAAS